MHFQPPARWQLRQRDRAVDSTKMRKSGSVWSEARLKKLRSRKLGNVGCSLPSKPEWTTANWSGFIREVRAGRAEILSEDRVRALKWLKEARDYWMKPAKNAEVMA